ncbi:MAG TPA: hypothetical protein VNI57_12675, partial [Candidatus Saccharimonadales bacterium]|nr:hypothetical protein [Candidatus Saccharimonadales bacterium]
MHAAGGVDGLILCTALLTSLTALVLLAAAREAGAPALVAAPGVALALFAAASRFYARPHL